MPGLTAFVRPEVSTRATSGLLDVHVADTGYGGTRADHCGKGFGVPDLDGFGCGVDEEYVWGGRGLDGRRTASYYNQQHRNRPPRAHMRYPDEDSTQRSHSSKSSVDQ